MLANISYKWGDMKMWSKVYQNRKTDWVFGVGGGVLGFMFPPMSKANLRPCITHFLSNQLKSS